jgi:hypothetical protein
MRNLRIRRGTEASEGARVWEFELDSEEDADAFRDLLLEKGQTAGWGNLIIRQDGCIVEISADEPIRWKNDNE